MASLAPFLIRRGAVYHVRCRVPLDLVAVIGRAEYKRSLKTTCPRTARSKVALVKAALTRVFDEIRAMPDPKDDLIELLMDSLDEYESIDQTRAKVEEARARSVAWAASLQEMKTVTAHAKELDALRVLIDSAVTAPMPDEARRTLVAALRGRLDGIRAEAEAVGSEEIIELAEKVGALQQKLANTESFAVARIEELEGKLSVNLGQLGALLADAGVVNRQVDTPTVLDYLDGQYLEEKSLQDDARRHVISYVDLFARITGNRKLATYGRHDVVTWIRTLEKVKNTYGKSPKDKTLSIEDLLKSSHGKPTFSATTLEKHLTHVKAFFRAAARSYRFATVDDIDQIFDDVEFRDFVPGAKVRKPWLPQHLTALFASPIWTGTRSTPAQVTKRHLPGTHIYRDAYWWLPVMALWTGCRLEELAQLHHEDLEYDINQIPFIRIHNEGIRRLKNEHARRNVPVHSMLIRLGVLGLFKSSRRGMRIFPDLIPSGRLKKLGDTYSTHFTDYRKRCGLYEDLRDFHSLRRTFITTMRTRAKVDPLTVAAIAGHDEETEEARLARQTDDYTTYDISYLKESIEKLDYAANGVDLSPLLRGLD